MFCAQSESIGTSWLPANSGHFRNGTFRALLAFTNYEDLRGQIIKEGGLKLCLHLCKEATPEGKIKASHAIARLGIKADPAICFPGQRAYEVVKPLIDLLHPDIAGKQNYDALLTLTNLVRRNIRQGDKEFFRLA